MQLLHVADGSKFGSVTLVIYVVIIVLMIGVEVSLRVRAKKRAGKEASKALGAGPSGHHAGIEQVELEGLQERLVAGA
jgi:membrane protein required for beta-lactamase induction